MNAKEMFEELGYSKSEFRKHIKYENNGNVVIFDNDSKMVRAIDLFLQEQPQPKPIYMNLLKAINKQCEELGWLDE